jgi:hypothetical protein
VFHHREFWRTKEGNKIRSRLKFKKTKREKDKGKNDKCSEASSHLHRAVEGWLHPSQQHWLPVPMFAGSSSSKVGSSVGALAGDALAGGVVDGGGTMGASSNDSPYCCPSPASPKILAAKVETSAPASGK